MINANVETIVLLNKAKIPGNPHVATRWRWAKTGVRGGVKLETIVIGGQRFTSPEAIGRFIARLNESDTAPAPAPSRAAEEADRRLAAAGV